MVPLGPNDRLFFCRNYTRKGVFFLEKKRKEKNYTSKGIVLIENLLRRDVYGSL